MSFKPVNTLVVSSKIYIQGTLHIVVTVRYLLPKYTVQGIIDTAQPYYHCAQTTP